VRRKEFPEAELHLNAALELGLRTTNDTALVTMILAHLCFVQGKKAEAKNYLERVKALAFNDLMLKEKVVEMEGCWGEGCSGHRLRVAKKCFSPV
jgi:hypothetical protein